MLNQPINNLRKKLGSRFIPLILVFFAFLLIVTMFTSVRQKRVDYREGQVASESIRANKTIENSAETDQKRQLAAEAVTPEYTFQPELAETQHDRISQLIDLVLKTNSDIDKANQTKVSQAKEGETVPQPTVEERVAAVKKNFENINQDTVSFYQKLPENFFRLVVQLNSQQLEQVKTSTLKLNDEQMSKRIRESDLEIYRQQAIDQVSNLGLTDNQNQVIQYLLESGIVVNDILNEKRTEDLREQAKSSVQPVMIYQGEIIVREGSQIDASAFNKLKLLGLTSSGGSTFPLIAMILSTILQGFVLWFYSRQFEVEFQRIRFILFYSASMIFSVLVMKFLQIFQSTSSNNLALFFPAAFVPLLLTVFVNRRAGSLAAVFQTIFALFVYYDSIGTNMLTIILMTYLFSGVLAVMVKQKRVSDQAKQALLWIVIFPIIWAIILNIYQGLSFTNSATWGTLICAVAGSLLSFLLGTGLQPYIELLVTDNGVITLNELSNPNHPLLKQLLEEAPGTYHHSMMVANLSANAVAEIGGRSLLTRVACYYHDIGKIRHANFFVENLPPGAENPHNFLLPEDSKQIIFGHVIEGAKILEEYKMPQMVIDICYQHHGTTLMKFFYVKAKERNPEITEAEFRYPGPKPQTREAGVVSIADSCEAAVRAMDHPSIEKISSFVHDLIEERISDGQLDESGLTLKEIRIVEKSLVSSLSSTFHSRIKYPKMKSEAEKMKEEQERGER
ncbi:HD family phosphohydrolase [Enterococcus pallens]|uniref:HD protein n=1 Tax=Enterococcus pallens ATCC BAA-351 TaxID=1158607 RepID=R2PTC4_9ENTE|nr:HDIG domain-containing metalloprotein [Enterococcus pallens]EOH86558.1 HD protein [Enterococcus pallens ATCC BAA-351]EOU18354.1 HD protein [Enterococcus pallens ATCC BAA-351]OJG81334.1 HD protein [Enterococcus pallens]